MSDTSGVTKLLVDWRAGNEQALAALTPVVYQELRRLALQHMRSERTGHTLQPTALVNEAYIRLVGQNMPDFQCRSHFFGVAAQVMRQVLIDFARKRLAAKRGGGQRADLEEAMAVSTQQSEEFLALHEALDRLAAQDARKAKVIELKYFGGLRREEIAESLGLTLATVKRDLLLGELWLRREMGGGGEANKNSATP
ncbi:MAG TPA: ECF-type sigma factor [Bryobacteraceae bacterium]|nr:ECF-type sigma factor [Bryobacteraceae bacterium]